MRAVIILVMLFVSTICRADINLKIYSEKVSNGYEIYADNQEVCPLSVKIDYELENLNVSGGNNKIYLVEANAKKQLLAKLTIVDIKKAWSFSYKYWTNYGNHSLDTYDKSYIYDLPFQSPGSFIVSQGYNSSFSHKGENSIDFTMPEGTKIVAVRDGIVVKVVNEYNTGCPREECQKYNNEILIYHPDATFAVYLHFKQFGTAVNAGDKVERGQVISYSGNTGWSNGPHLHISIFLPRLYERKTLETKFRVGNGDRVEYLIEKKTYAKNY